MTLSTLPRFLAGDRRAIVDVATDPRSLLVGLLFVLAAAFAREYDRADLLAEPWLLLLPLGASLVLSFALFLPVRLLAAGGGDTRGHEQPPFGKTYRSFLGVFWMTAPLALLYAIPYERFLSEGNATRANLWTLAAVAAWRVLLITRAVAVLAGRSFLAAFFVVMAVADVAALLALYLSPLPVIDLMGGVLQSPRERMLLNTALLTAVAGALTLPVWLVGAIAVLARKAPAGDSDEGAEFPQPRRSRGPLLVAVAAVAVWGLVLPRTQAEQRLRTRVERDLRGGRVDEALQTMSARVPGDFPPHWDPPPRPAYHEDHPPLLDLMELIAARVEEGRPHADWVRGLYAEKFGRAYLGGRHFGFTPEQAREMQRAEQLLERLPEGPALARKYADEIAWARRVAAETAPTGPAREGVDSRPAATHKTRPSHEP